VYVAGTAALVGGAWAGVKRFRQTKEGELPVAAARKGEFLAIIRSRGDLKAARSAQIYTPLVPNLTIAWMVPAGEIVEKGQPVVRFDSSSSQQDLIRKDAALKQAQATLDQAAAQSKITMEHDQNDLIDAQYNLEKAQLQTAGNQFIARIQAEQAKIDLSVAEQKLKVQQANIALHQASEKSRMASLTRQRDLAQADIDLTKDRLGKMEIVAPLTGMVVFSYNYSPGSINSRPFKVGDNAASGINLAEMPDLDSLMMDVKVEEIDRGRIGVGHEVRIRVDALPEVVIAAKITQISPLAELGNEYPPTRSFRAYAALGHTDSRLRPGMNGGMDIIIDKLPNAISIPAKAVFTRAGKPAVFLSEQGHYRPVEIQLLARNPDEVAVSGIHEGALVTLVDPEKLDTKK
jgi:multidrug efflux pump subunit AcrA (membrane-fusion protein)